MGGDGAMWCEHTHLPNCEAPTEPEAVQRVDAVADMVEVLRKAKRIRMPVRGHTTFGDAIFRWSAPAYLEESVKAPTSLLVPAALLEAARRRLRALDAACRDITDDKCAGGGHRGPSLADEWMERWTAQLARPLTLDEIMCGSGHASPDMVTNRALRGGT